MAVKHLNEDNFEQEIKKGIVLIDFWADWCGPCQMLGPIFEELSEEYDKLAFVKVNTDENPHLSNKFSISGIPCIIILKDGRETSRIVGLLPKDSLKQKFDQL